MKSKNKYGRDFWNSRCLFLLFVSLVALVLLKDTTPSYAQRPPTRAHTVTQKNPIELVPATVKLREAPHVSVKTVGGKRVVTSNGIPNHLVGQFPNCGNPHTIERQHHSFTITSSPILATSPIWLESGWVFGIAVNGIPWEPLAAEWYHGQRDSKWRYEALSGAIDLGADGNYAHVQPGGKYHYHGLPTGLLGAMNVSRESTIWNTSFTVSTRSSARSFERSRREAFAKSAIPSFFTGVHSMCAVLCDFCSA